jgi:hypothetical protein
MLLRVARWVVPLMNIQNGVEWIADDTILCKF